MNAIQQRMDPISRMRKEAQEQNIDWDYEMDPSSASFERMGLMMSVDKEVQS
jgi:hypothetical protein